MRREREFVDTEVRDAFGVWLQRWPWSHFYTVTFRWARQPHTAESTITEVTNVLRGPLGLRNFFLGTELHLNRTVHVHGLLDIRGRHSAFVVADIFDESLRRWGRSEVSPVQSREAVATYVSKYVTKRLTAWWLQA